MAGFIIKSEGKPKESYSLYRHIIEKKSSLGERDMLHPVYIWRFPQATSRQAYTAQPDFLKEIDEELFKTLHEILCNKSEEMNKASMSIVQLYFHCV